MQVDFSNIGGQSPQDLQSGGSENLGRFEFLELLVAQLKHQDPLKPMENTEFVSQMAQFSSLDELVKIRQINEASMAAMNTLLAALNNAGGPGPTQEDTGGSGG